MGIIYQSKQVGTADGTAGWLCSYMLPINNVTTIIMTAITPTTRVPNVKTAPIVHFRRSFLSISKRISISLETLPTRDSIFSSSRLVLVSAAAVLATILSSNLAVLAPILSSSLASIPNIRSNSTAFVLSSGETSLCLALPLSSENTLPRISLALSVSVIGVFLRFYPQRVYVEKMRVTAVAARQDKHREEKCHL